ncbi:sulfatase family protein [Maribacter stanieri]|uniref:Arylsulfatase A n=1 Tax=Maribacter stanieri TaxID=440514 RepID=A0A1I6IJV8_9FLAO|nr:sulfatase [Maribacter stanieri]SFR66978.1 Arylsulfatase A [Maribacter stanieri]
MVKNYFSAINVISLLFPLFILMSCEVNNKESKKEVAKTEIQLPKRPNILWLVTEDMGPYIPSFGDSTIVTPNLSRLSAEGVVYPNLYSTSGVCAPSRSAIIMGMYPSSIGANHMRTTSYTEVTGLSSYGAVPPPQARMISELLRLNGYYTTNNYKEDYQFDAPKTAWDESSPYAHWRNRDENQPFFSVFNYTETHESGLFEPYGFREIETRHYHEGDRTFKWGEDRMTEEETTIHLPKDTDFNIPPYLPNTPKVQRDMWKLYNNVSEMDKQVGTVLKQLEEDGLLENTIIFFYGDHGGPLPREKRLIYDSGLNTPMIIRFPKKQLAGTKATELLSFVDFGPTLLSLIGVKPPSYMQGQAFLGKYKAENERKYIHGAADRFDGFTDVIRAVRDEQFKYIRNYRPEQGYYLPVEYRERIPAMQELLRLRNEGNLDSSQELWFRESKDVEELYDVQIDPYEVNNLAKDPIYSDKLVELSAEMDRWLKGIGDDPNLPEKELITKLWNGAETQPITLNPEIKLINHKITLNSFTEGASLGYKIIDKEGKLPNSWTIYQKPFEIPRASIVIAQAYRIGYVPSETVTLSTK